MRIYRFRNGNLDIRSQVLLARGGHDHGVAQRRLSPVGISNVVDCFPKRSELPRISTSILMHLACPPLHTSEFLHLRGMTYVVLRIPSAPFGASLFPFTENLRKGIFRFSLFEGMKVLYCNPGMYGDNS